MKWFILHILALAIINVCFSNDKIGPYDLIIKGMEYCANQSDMRISFDYKLRKPNRTTFVLDGRIFFDMPITDDIKFKIRVDQLTNGGWKENFFSVDSYSFGNMGVCSVLKTYAPDVGRRALKAAGIKETDCTKTPIQPGNYTFNDFALVLDASKVLPVYYYSKYRAPAFLYYHGKMVACAIFYADFVPKKGRKG